MASQHHEMRKMVRKETEIGTKSDTDIKTDTLTEIKNERETRTSIEIGTSVTRIGTEEKIKIEIESTVKDQGN